MRVRRVLLLALAAAASAADAAEDAAPLLSAVTGSPALESARRRIDAAQARVGAAGRLADPELEAMGSRANRPGTVDDRSMWELSVRQPLPRRGERAADRERATAVVSMAEAELAMVAGDTAADAAMAAAVTTNAKVSRPSACNAAEQLLVHARVAETFLPAVARALEELSFYSRSLRVLGTYKQARPRG